MECIGVLSKKEGKERIHLQYLEIIREFDE